MTGERKIDYGARIERGEIIDIVGEQYEISSYDRDGMICVIPAINDESYAVGNRVYFFLFNDGTGGILKAF